MRIISTLRDRPRGRTALGNMIESPIDVRSSPLRFTEAPPYPALETLFT